MDKEIFVGLDIGTTKVACIIAERGEDDGLKIVGVGSHPSFGLRKGIVTDMALTERSIKKAVEEAELMAGVDVSEVWVGIAGNHIKSMSSNGPVAITHSDGKIRQEDIDRAIEVAKARPIPQDYQLLHVIPQEYSVDDNKGIKNPLDMSGTRLETKVYIATGQATRIQDITRCVEKAGLKLVDLVLEPLASSYAVLEKDEMELGVALVDIGGGTTDIAVYFDDNIRHVSIIEVGGKNITKDIAVGLKTPHEKAEEIKKKYGCAYHPLVRGGERLLVQRTGGHEDEEVSREVLVGIVEVRVEEMLAIALMEIKNSGYQDLLGAGVVLTGGSAMLEGIREKAESVFQMPVRIGVPGRFSGLTEAVKSPIHSTGIGLCMYAAEKSAPTDKGKSSGGGEGGYRRTMEDVVTWFKKYF